MELITETYKSKIACVLSCYDRLILSGTLSGITDGAGMPNYVYQKEVKIFDYPKFAGPFKEVIRKRLQSGALTRALYISSLQWKPAIHISLGTTKQQEKKFKDRPRQMQLNSIRNIFFRYVSSENEDLRVIANQILQETT